MKINSIFNGYLIVLVLNLSRVFSVVVLKEHDFREVEELASDEFSEDEIFINGGHTLINSTVHRTVKRYYCSVNNLDDSFLLVYGTKSWTFPKQDVNLVLSYPTANVASSEEDDFTSYIITGMRVILYIDGTSSSGYITSGGILQDFISMSFTCSNITMLSYQFWLYGTPKLSSNITDTYNVYYLC